jgi:YggT family protein
MLFQIFSLILQVVVGVVASTCLLRMYMHLQRVPLSARSGNPLAPFIFAVTNWIVLPVRRSVPALGRLDTASLIAAYAVLLAKHTLLGLVSGVMGHWLSLFTHAGFELLSTCLSSLTWLVIIYAVLSWMKSGTDVSYFLAQMVEPLLQPLRRVLPHMGGVDLSPLALLLILQIAEIVLNTLRMSVVF